tara:strand:- start:855 stop:1025 length:171 start_codon:yes stop_codon:yes gene_type:complete
MSDVEIATLRKLRENKIEPDLDFLQEFAVFDNEVQDNLIKTFKKFPEIEARYKWIK